MKDYLKLRIPYRVRIHGGGCDVSARATHHTGKKDRLITNKSAFSAKAELGNVPFSTIERKQMSTKTNFKRIAVVAVASLGLGVFTSIAPANAAPTTTTATPWEVTLAYAKSANTGTQLLGGVVTLTYTETATTAAAAIVGNITSSGVGNINSAVKTTGATADVAQLGTVSGTETFPNTGVSRVTTDAQTDDLNVYTVTVTSTVAGTQTLTATINDANGTPISSKTATVTWVATGAGVGVNAANSTLYVDTDSTCITGQTSKATDAAAAAAVTLVRVAAASPSSTLCVIARDASNNLVPLASATAISTLGGSGSGSGTLSSGRYKWTVAGITGITGTAAITAILVDTYGNAVTLSTSLNYYGTLASLSLANIGYAATPGGTAPASTDATADVVADGAGLPGKVASKGIYLAVVGKDATGNVIDLVPSSTPDSFTLDSDKVAGAPVAGASDTLGTTAAMSTGASDISAASFGTNVALVTCGAKAEKVTVNVRGLTSASARVTSNDVVVYCSGAVDKVTVTAAGTSVNVDVTDANGYPVADGTSVALAASNGSVVAPSTKTTANGKFATAATFIANSTAATSSVTAIVGDKSGTSAAVKGSGTSIEAQIASMLKLINKIMKRLNIR
jgi:trimeric autotransporter adhesin